MRESLLRRLEMMPIAPLCCAPEAFALLARQLPTIDSSDALLNGAMAIAMHQVDGATVADVQLMREKVGPSIGVKASGGIRTFNDAMKMINAGANRLGASSSVAIIQASNAAASGNSGY